MELNSSMGHSGKRASYLWPIRSVPGLDLTNMHVSATDPGAERREQLLGPSTCPSVIFGPCAMKAAGFLAPAAWQMGPDLCSN